jgi:hypothetical protein
MPNQLAQQMAQMQQQQQQQQAQRKVSLKFFCIKNNITKMIYFTAS